MATNGTHTLTTSTIDATGRTIAVGDRCYIDWALNSPDGARHQGVVLKIRATSSVTRALVTVSWDDAATLPRLVGADQISRVWERAA